MTLPIQAIERTVSDVHFNSEVRRRIRDQVKSPPARHAMGTGDPETLVRFNAPPPQAPPQGRGAAVLEGQPQLVREYVHHHT